MSSSPKTKPTAKKTVQPNLATKPGTSKPVHQNDTYNVIVGIPPSTTEMPDPIPAYLIVNKETGVVESWHGILFYAKQNADLFHDMLTKTSEEKKPDAAEITKALFN